MCKKVYAHTSYKARLRPLQRNGVPCVTAALNKIPCCILHTHSSCMCGYVLSSKVLKHRYASVTVSCSDPHQPALICLMCLSCLTASVLCCAALLQVITRLLIGCFDRTEESRSPRAVLFMPKRGDKINERLYYVLPFSLRLTLPVAEWNNCLLFNF